MKEFPAMGSTVWNKDFKIAGEVVRYGVRDGKPEVRIRSNFMGEQTWPLDSCVPILGSKQHCERYVVQWDDGKRARVDEVTRKAEAMLREMAVKPEDAASYRDTVVQIVDGRVVARTRPPTTAQEVAADKNRRASEAEAAARKAIPLATGCLDYFPDALKAVASLSKAGNDQHNPGQPLHWSRGKSNDHADCLARHLTERGTIDTDGQRHSAKVAWRALALLQIEIEESKK